MRLTFDPVMRIRGVPTRRHAFAVTGLLFLVACGRSAEQAPSVPQGAPEPATSEASSPSPAEAARPAAAPAPAPVAPSSTRANAAEEEKRDEGFARPADKDDLGQAVAELERAHAEFESAIPKQKARSSSAPAGAAASRGADLDQAPPAKAEKKTEESSCSTACRAYSSLGRAASAVCRLAGEKDARCTHAHRVVADAQRRVAVCGCQNE
jgi:hypothetical protein